MINKNKIINICCNDICAEVLYTQDRCKRTRDRICICSLNIYGPGCHTCSIMRTDQLALSVVLEALFMHNLSAVTDTVECIRFTIITPFVGFPCSFSVLLSAFFLYFLHGLHYRQDSWNSIL